MITENNITNESHRFRLILAGKLNLKDANENMALVNVSIYYTWKNIKSAYNNNNSISDIQDHFDYIIKKHELIAYNPPV